ncbi:hypothetical protein LTR36_003308 [Oleoguttula mirabilis]|uniref:Uncharacterized protein n=1 Tax=Oleoguttula mirabilis TaxID=1507867 RepID=A0AAV9JYX2_9PEZI|nr:hypothetical protein LTR36_003308 [Oleoguttula mirabilis]
MYQLPRALRLRQQHPIFRHAQRQHQRNFSQIQRHARAQLAFRPGGEVVRYQAVRFKRPGFFTWRRLATTVLYGGVVYAYANVIGRYLEIEVEILEDDETDAKQQNKKDGEGKEVTEAEAAAAEEGPFYAEEDSTFIPMTWATKAPRTFYRGSDPEWQDFVKIAKDKPRHKKLQNELVQMVYSGCTKHPAVARQLGKDIKVGKYWLDISFPDGPPQEYERSGVEVGDGFVAWSRQKITPEQQWRTMRALWPQAALDSFYATGKVLVGMQYRRVKQALGWEGKDPFSPEERYRHAIEMVQKQQQAREGKREVGRGKTQQTPDGVVSGAASPSSSSSSSLVESSSSSSSAPASETQPAKPPRSPSTVDEGKKLPWQVSVPMPSAPTGTHNDAPVALHVFATTLTKQWNPKKAEPPRGTFVVQGLVEVRGQKGRMLFDVQSCYDPKAGKFVAVNAAARSFKRWNQSPKGGP